jgi:hypothetical protein
MGIFNKKGIPRVEDLIGSVYQQNWTPATLVNINPFEGIALGFQSGQIGYVDFTNYSESTWQIVSGKHIFGDRRHRHTLKRFRLVIRDIFGPVSYTVTVVNEANVTQSQTVTLGTGSGDDLTYIMSIPITGLRLQWTVTGPPKAGASFVEFALIYDTAGEQRGGSVDGN